MQLSLNKEIVYNKIVIMRDNLFIIKNMTQTIYQHCGKLMKINRFDWFEPTAELFHLQINLLTMFFDKLWGKPRNITSLDQYTKVSKRLKMSKDIKNFYTCDTFLKHLIDIYVIALIMKESSQKNIDEF